MHFSHLCSFDSLRVHGGDAWEGNNIIPAIENVELSSIVVYTPYISGTCLKRSPLGQISVAALERWLQYANIGGVACRRSEA